MIDRHAFYNRAYFQVDPLKTEFFSSYSNPFLALSPKFIALTPKGNRFVRDPWAVVQVSCNEVEGGVSLFGCCLHLVVPGEISGHSDA